jgi:hypothetical protein
MSYFKRFALTAFLFTIPSLTLYPESKLPRFVTHPHDFQAYTSCEEIMSFMQELESDDIEEKYSDEDLEKIGDFVIFMLRIGASFSPPEEKQVLEQEIQELLALKELITTLKGHLKNISLIADKEYQRRVWIQGQGPELSDFHETVSRCFDIGDPILQNLQKYDFSEKQYLALLNFRNALEAFVQNHDSPAEFIDTPEWTHITEMAQEVIDVLNEDDEA